MGIDTVCIEDPYEAFETTHLIINEEREKYYVSEVQKILENHIYHGKNSLSKMAELANEIVSEITKAEQPKVIDIEERNGNLYEHTVQVTMLSLAVAKMLKVKEEDYIDIAIGHYCMILVCVILRFHILILIWIADRHLKYLN